MGSPRPIAVVALAIAGVIMIAGLTYSASTLISQPIGLATGRASLDASLAPPHSPGHTTKPPAKRTRTTTTTNRTPATVTTTPVTTSPTPGIAQPTTTPQPRSGNTVLQPPYDD